MSNDKLDNIDNKLEKISQRLGSIDSTLAAQYVSLADHIRRTALLESKFEPVERHVAQVSGVFKFLGLVATIGAIVEGAIIALTYIKS